MFDFEMLELEFDERAEKTLNKLKDDLQKIQIGRANPNILNNIKVSCYGEKTPIIEVATISVPEPSQLLIKPYDQSITTDIVLAINSSQLGIAAVDEGDKARMTFPILTTDRRKEMVKSLSKNTEAAKISIRQARQDANKKIKSAEKASDGISEDEQKRFEEEVQKWTNKYSAEVEALVVVKEKQLMTL